MKRQFFNGANLLLVALLFFSTQIFAADNDVTGLWKTYNIEGNATSLTRLKVVDGELQGVVEKVLPVNGVVATVCTACTGENQNKPILGMTVVWGLTQQGNEWVGGHALHIRTGAIYPCKIQLSDDGQTLNLTVNPGSVFSARTVHWERVQ